MNTLGVIFGALLLGSTMIPATTTADAARAQSRAVEPLTQVERALFTKGTVSYLHPGVAQALGLSLAHGAISVFQREADMPHGGKVIAVTVREVGGQKNIVLASWNETEVRAYLTSPSGILRKAVQASKDQERWKEIPVGKAQKAYATEKQYWLGASAGGTFSAETRADR